MAIKKGGAAERNFSERSLSITNGPVKKIAEAVRGFRLSVMPLDIVESVRDEKALLELKTEFSKLPTSEKLIIFNKIVTYIRALLGTISQRGQYAQYHQIVVNMNASEAWVKKNQRNDKGLSNQLVHILFTDLFPRFIVELEAELSSRTQKGIHTATVDSARRAAGLIS